MTQVNRVIPYGSRSFALSKLDAMGWVGPAAEARQHLVLHGSMEDAAQNLAHGEHATQHTRVGERANGMRKAIATFQDNIFNGQMGDTYAQMLAESPLDPLFRNVHPPLVAPLILSTYEVAPPKEAFKLVEQGELSVLNIRGIDVRQRR